MSSIWTKPTTTTRHKELQWYNLCYGAHDLYCQCKEPDLHFLILMNKFSNAPKPENDIRNIKCLLTGLPTEEDGEDHFEEDFGFHDGELEKLFTEEGGQENTEEPTER